MVRIFSFVLAFVVFAALVLYAQYVVRRFGPVSTAPKPRGWRLALFWAAMSVTIVALLPGVAVAIAYLFRVTDCPAQVVPGLPWQCSPMGRAGITLGTIVVLMPLAMRWVRFLRDRAAAPREPSRMD